MKKIKIKFIGLGYNNIFQANVKIYNDKNKLIYQGKTKNNELILCLKPNKTYYLTASVLSSYIDTIFYVNDYQNDYIFIFNHAIIRDNTEKKTITFLLTDYYYDNLKIEKGEMIIWTKQ